MARKSQASRMMSGYQPPLPVPARVLRQRVKVPFEPKYAGAPCPAVRPFDLVAYFVTALFAFNR